MSLPCFPLYPFSAVVDGEIKKISLSDYKGKYVVLFFYPKDFTFVCPTEIIAFSGKQIRMSLNLKSACLPVAALWGDCFLKYFPAADRAKEFEALNCQVSHLSVCRGSVCVCECVCVPGKVPITNATAFALHLHTLTLHITLLIPHTSGYCRQHGHRGMSPGVDQDSP